MPENRLPAGSHHSSVGSFLEQLTAAQPELLRPELSHGDHSRHAVAHTAAEVYARCLLEIPHRYWNITELEAKVHALSEELRVEYKIVRIVQKRHSLEHLATVGSKAAMEITQILAERDVFKNG